MPFAFVDELICIALACTHLALPIVISTIFFVSLCKRLLYLFAPDYHHPSNEAPAADGHWYTL